MNETELPPLPDDVAKLLRAAAAPTPPPGFHDSVRARVNASLDLTPSVPALGRYGPGLSGATLVLGLIGGVLLGPLLRPEPAKVVVPPAPLVESPRVEPPHLMAPTLPEPEPAPKKVTVARVPAPVVLAPGPSRDFELADERATVDMARSALARGDSTQALVVIDALAKRLPRGQLAEERESLAVEALMAAGKVSDAKARAAKFREDFPQSMLLPAVDAALETGTGR